MKASQVEIGCEIVLPNKNTRLCIISPKILEMFLADYGDVDVVARSQRGSIKLPTVYDVPAFAASRERASKDLLAHYEWWENRHKVK